MEFSEFLKILVAILIFILVLVFVMIYVAPNISMGLEKIKESQWP